MIHGEFRTRKFFFTMVADSFAHLLTPPGGVPHFASLGALALNVGLVDRDNVCIGVARLRSHEA